MSLRSGSGTIAAQLDGGVRGWAMNNLRYDFGPYSGDDVRVEFVKHGDKTFQARVCDSSGAQVFLDGQLPSQLQPIAVSVNWKGGDVTMEIEGTLADTQHAP